MMKTAVLVVVPKRLQDAEVSLQLTEFSHNYPTDIWDLLWARYCSSYRGFGNFKTKSHRIYA